MFISNQIKILKKTINALEKETKIDPYKIERFRHQLSLAIIQSQENLNGRSSKRSLA